MLAAVDKMVVSKKRVILMLAQCTAPKVLKPYSKQKACLDDETFHKTLPLKFYYIKVLLSLHFDSVVATVIRFLEGHL